MMRVKHQSGFLSLVRSSAVALLPRFGNVGCRTVVVGGVDDVFLVLAALGANVLVHVPAFTDADGFGGSVQPHFVT
jgi:hypothetical protein